MWEMLSLEIIFEIFAHFLPGLKLSITEPHQFPWYLGQVCMTWRTAFLTFPQLWRAFDIDLWKRRLNYNDTTRKHRLTMLEESLLRSGNHTICFRFTSVWRLLYCRSLSPSDEVLWCGEILDRLVAQSTRWRDAYFMLHICEAETLYRVKNRLPMLRSLQCTFVPDPTQAVVQGFSNLLVDAPRLTRIFLDDSIEWNIDWSSMTSIHFEFVAEVPYFLACLKQACRLEELAIRRMEFSTLSPDTPPINLPSLKVLDVCDLGPLPLFETPALEELYTSYGATKDFRYEWIAKSYIIRSLRHLRKLSIFVWNENQLKHLIRILPAAQDLYVHCRDHPDLLELLPACPKACEVKTLTFTLSLFDLMKHIAAKDLSRIITGWKKKRHTVAGFGPFSKLTKISIVFLRPVDEARVKSAIVDPPDALDRLRRHFEAQGIQYSIQQRDVFGAHFHQVHHVPPFDTLLSLCDLN